MDKQILLEIEHKPIIANIAAGISTGLFLGSLMAIVFSCYLILFAVVFEYLFNIKIDLMQIYPLIIAPIPICGIILGAIMPFLNDPIYKEKKIIKAKIVKSV